MGADIVTFVVFMIPHPPRSTLFPYAALFPSLAELYVDGLLVARDTTNPITSVRTSTQTIVGRVASAFTGNIDVVLIYTRALSHVQIDGLAPPPAADGPLLRYDMPTLTPTGLM